MDSQPRSGVRNNAFVELVGRAGLASDICWLLGMTIGLGFTVLAAYAFPYPESRAGIFFAYLCVMLRLALYFAFADRWKESGGALIGKLVTFGLVAGFFELLADYWLVNGVTSGRLVYTSGRDVVLLASPLYMPFAWACVIAEFGYLICRLYSILSVRRNALQAAAIASVAGGLAAGFSIGLYEYFAYRAGWWFYEAARAMIGRYCALYIPVGEVLMFAAFLPIFARAAERKENPVFGAMAYGALFGGCIFAAYAIAHTALERF